MVSTSYWHIKYHNLGLVAAVYRTKFLISLSCSFLCGRKSTFSCFVLENGFFNSLIELFNAGNPFTLLIVKESDLKYYLLFWAIYFIIFYDYSISCYLL